MSSPLSCPPGTVLHMQKGALSTAEVCEAQGLSQMRGWRWDIQMAQRVLPILQITNLEGRLCTCRKER